MEEVQLEPLKPRGYQLEMLRMSMERNIVVAMDTGSGKTLVAALRIQAELERCSSDKRVWFLCPTIALAEQQRDALARSLPRAFTSIVLSGNDGVDHWSSREIWNRVLNGVSVVICTYQVLLDALNFSFVLLEEIALLVIDESHHCQGKHPVNKILQDHYHPARRVKEVPHILGLTASPVENSKSGDIDAIESNLNAICRSPKDFREEFLSHVYLPGLRAMIYHSQPIDRPLLLVRLFSIKCEMSANFQKDPWVIFLKQQRSLKYQQQLEDALLKGKTWCWEHIGRICTTADDICQDLGYWAALHYVKTCVSRILDARETRIEDSIRQQELLYLATNLSQLEPDQVRCPDINSDDALSPKLRLLIDIIVEHWTPKSTAIVFVRTRNAVQLLSSILSSHAKTHNLLRVGTFVGLSANPARGSQLTELIDSKGQEETLDHLRTGAKNLLISTSVCEEGIDVSACNLVICYEAPPNLRAFIQRRGRARSSNSKYIIMFPGDKTQLLQHWYAAEERMKRQYMDDKRQIQELERLESDEIGYRELKTSSDAKLTLDNAIPVLHHFCAKSPEVAFATRDPIYTYSQDEDRNMTCSILLPGSVEPSLRLHHSSKSNKWKSQRLARRDAAFEAVSALYAAQLLNAHLMPDSVIDAALSAVQEDIEGRPNVTLVDSQYDPWGVITGTWDAQTAIYAHEVHVSVSDGRNFVISMLLPAELPSIVTGELFIDAQTTAKVHFGPANIKIMDDRSLELARKATKLLLTAAMPNRLCGSDEFAVLFVPANVDSLAGWIEGRAGTLPAVSLVHSQPSETIGLIRDQSRWGAPHVYLGTDMVAPGAEDMGYRGAEPMNLDGAVTPAQAEDRTETAPARPMLRAKRFPKRMDFLHQIEANEITPSRRYYYLEPNCCTVDRLPATWASFVRWIPSILHQFQVQLIVDGVRQQLLPHIPFEPEHLFAAISTGSARNDCNYQRLEFLGDSLLSTYTSLSLMVVNPLWHEGYLSRAKDHQVSNGTLSRACQATGLSKYIMTEPFAGSKWRPLYIPSSSDNTTGSEPSKASGRELSTKTLADVVEAILGAAWVSGDEKALLDCLATVLTPRKWQSATQSLTALRLNASELYQSQTPVPQQYLQRLTRLIGYEFTIPGLAHEALTHPSYNTGLINMPSYQRLEFLGDSILESIVTKRIFRHDSLLPVDRMHSIRTAAVNGQFLAFCAMMHEVEVTRTLAHVDEHLAKRSQRGAVLPVNLEEKQESLCLSSFLRMAPDAAMHDVLDASRQRFHQWSPAIMNKLSNGEQYPWTELASFNPEKMFSDVVESVIAAIAVDQGYFGSDSTGTNECAVERWLERLGVLKWLDKMLQSPEYRVMHPKEQIGILAVDRPVRYEHWVAAAGPDNRTVETVAEDQSAKGEKAEAEKSKTWPSIAVDGFAKEGDRLHCYNLYVGGRQVCSATGLSARETETRVAERGSDILRAESETHKRQQQVSEEMQNTVASINGSNERS